MDPRATPLATKNLEGQIYNLIETAQKQSSLKVGINEATKQAMRGQAALIIIAANASPLEVALALPLVCEDKGIPYVFVSEQEGIGRAAQVSRSAGAVAILNSIDVSAMLHQIEML
ncbi:Ribosomal protein L7Ae [Spironucleus salmonicida]|uniref:H/ACA ribonucleoprotein complex subunit 2 n=1 Tax=Spironucleus salmonicida TaxID=348837 RepID=V6LTY4_9EUKA|nr:Ribosomal protein L7Ae [Spironucleus salmonicida]|eukprot:EST47678.1 Ribosomal protein L7Ae [Spironucleus salmonicida]